MEVSNLEIMIKEALKKVVEEQNTNKQTFKMGIFDSMDDAIEAAFEDQKVLKTFSLEKRGKIVDSIRNVARKFYKEFSEMTVEESKMGNVKDKMAKNLLVAEKTPGVEDLITECKTGDDGMTVTELSPFGVIGAITPTTNPTETILCNAIGMVAAGNSVVISPHPTSKNVSLFCIQKINEEIFNESGLKNLITSVSNPTIQNANIMMSHPKINMLVATGGPGVVKSVLSSGKKAIGAGAGNPPVVVDDSADIEKAAKDIIDGCSFDNNLPCIAEKEVFVVENVADFLIFNMQASGGFLLKDEKDIKRLIDLVVPDNVVNKGFIGKDATYILDRLGIAHDKDVKAIIFETDFDNPAVQHELMMPVLPIVKVKNIDEAIEMAVKSEHGFRHTAIMHSKNVDNLTKFAKEIQTTIFVKNGPSYAGIGVGGEGFTTFTIAGPTGEGLTSARTFARKRRCVLVNSFSIR